MYGVVSSNLPENQEDNISHLLGKKQLSTVGATSTNNNSRQPAQNQPDPSLLRLQRLFKTVMDHHKLIEPNVERDRDCFRQILANTRYHQLKLGQEITRLEDAGFTAEADGMDLDKIWERLRSCDEQASEWDYRNTCRCLLYLDNRWDFATSSLFIVLPTDLDSWDDTDTSTHHFRLYFLCEVWLRDNNVKGVSQHIHLSNHQGYDLIRPQEFLHTYGEHVLRVLDLIQRGYSDRNHGIPPLDTLGILWGCDSDIMDKVSKDTIGPLVDKTIAYLQELSPSKWLPEVSLTRAQSAKIKEYLIVQDGDNAGGNLHRYIRSSQYVSWRCRTHAQQYLDPGSLESLEVFAHSHGGYIDVQRAKLKVELTSSTASDQFRAVLKDSKLRFDICVKLGWNATRSDVEELCSNIARTKAALLEIDGITLDTHPQNQVLHMSDLFGKSIRQPKLRLILLLNYPRPNEQYIYTGNCSFQSTLADQTPYSWVDLRSDLVKFSTTVSDAHELPEWAGASRVIRSVLNKHGFEEVTRINVHHKYWEGTFDLEEGAFVEVYLHNMDCPAALLTSGSLRKMTVHLDRNLDRVFFSLVQRSEKLQELNISAHGCDLFHLAARVIILHNSSSPLHLTLLERDMDKNSRIVAKMNIRGNPNNFLRSNPVNIHGPFSIQEVSREMPCVELLLWEYDQIFTSPSDYSAWFLDIATKQRPSVLTSFTLDTASLSRDGLACIHRVLRRSALQCLRIQCHLVASHLAPSVLQVLEGVHWCTIQSLVISGGSINEWIPFLMDEKNDATIDLTQLRHLEIIGTGSGAQPLVHKTALFIHKLLCTSPLLELRVENMVWKELHDGTLVEDAASFAYLMDVPADRRQPHEYDVFWYLHRMLLRTRNREPMTLSQA